MPELILTTTRTSELTDEEIAERVVAGETGLYEVLMRRYNQRLYRVGCAILKDDGEAEDLIQETYVRAFQHLRQFAGRSRFSTWLVRIAVHEAIARARRSNRFEEFDPMADSSDLPTGPAQPSPEEHAFRSETRTILERAIESLPENYRTVLILRDVEGMSTEETAQCLSLTEENVKVRLHRAHAMLRKQLYEQVKAISSQSFLFPAYRCDRVVQAVWRRIIPEHGS